MDLQQRRDKLNQYFCADEIATIQKLADSIERTPEQRRAISIEAQKLCRQASASQRLTPLQNLLKEFDISSGEGRALLALTEALLRIPDQSSAADLIADRLGSLKWTEHLSDSHTSLVNVSSLLLKLSGSLLHKGDEIGAETSLHRVMRHVAEPVVINAMRKGVSTLAEQFVLADNAEQAMASASIPEYAAIDMLGEAALSASQAESFYRAYESAVREVGKAEGKNRCSVSIKLSALYPRYEVRHRRRAVKAIVERLKPLVSLANSLEVELTLDAEEANRLMMGLEVFEALLPLSISGQKSCLGLAVQAYNVKAMDVLSYLQALAESLSVKIPLRLVKGAYWDAEIKSAQIEGLPFYPVYTNKRHTDIAYLACASYLLSHTEHFYPQFATHNAVTICDILAMQAPQECYEFQRLYGMGDALYQALADQCPAILVRAYCPVGEYKALLPYLIRRMLENGASTAFVKHMLSPSKDLNEVCEHPFERGVEYSLHLPLPGEIYASKRKNSKGLCLADPNELDELEIALETLSNRLWTMDAPNRHLRGASVRMVNDLAGDKRLGEVWEISADMLDEVLEAVSVGFEDWRKVLPERRIDTIDKFALTLEEHREELISLLVREAGKTIEDAIAEVREAIDFCYYYTTSLTNFMAQEAQCLPSVVGETNELRWEGRGVFLCISPWNFPLAIFCGQIVAALLCGNTVLAKPSGSTPLIADFVVKLLHRSGVPQDALKLISAPGDLVEKTICEDARLAGIAFTGSTTAAKSIHMALARNPAGIIPMIAETGGLNCMIVDSSALPEQVVKDVIRSAFYSAGQRCSALRVLYLQEEVADDMLALLKSALAEVCLGNPQALETDVGPLISGAAWQDLKQYCEAMEARGHLLFRWSDSQDDQSKLTSEQILEPHVFEIDSISDLVGEKFGPILHVIRYFRSEIDSVVKDINATGYGLTCGIHSRNQEWVDHLSKAIRVGNVYVNRDMVGAVVGAQPFGGRGLSGTGFKTGGASYLSRFMTEKTISTNTTAIGGDVDLVDQ